MAWSDPVVTVVNTKRVEQGRTPLAGVTLHTLRHTCASLLLTQGVHPRIVMETLGHSTFTLTMDTYSHVMPEQQREAAQRMGEALRW
jgi:integrase